MYAGSATGLWTWIHTSSASTTSHSPEQQLESFRPFPKQACLYTSLEAVLDTQPAVLAEPVPPGQEACRGLMLAVLLLSCSKTIRAMNFLLLLLAGLAFILFPINFSKDHIEKIRTTRDTRNQLLVLPSLPEAAMKYFTSSFPILISHYISSISATDYATNAESAITVLNDKWYSASTGLWDDLWWNSANAMTTIADLGLIDDSFKSTAEQIISTTYSKAPGRGGTNDGSYINDYYDDEGWWALGWIAAYDLTGNQDYLDTAVTIFDDMTTGWSTPCKGGIWWDKSKSYIAAISNELFLSVAAHLANRVPDQKTNYISWAQAEWDWFSHSGVINSANTINDGINKTTCANNGGTVFTYNQGVVLGGLIELSAATGDSSYLTEATTIANAALKALTDSNDILTESGGIDEDNNLAQFKGIFTRNLAALQKAAPNEAFVTFLTKNADSIWKSDRDAPTGFIGPHWQGPFAPATAPSQSSAIDCLVAAAAVS